MSPAPINTTLYFDATFASGLDVAMTVVRLSTNTVVQGPTAMVNNLYNTFTGSFISALTGESYLMIKAVYTDGTFTTLDLTYFQGSETIVMVDFATGGGGSASDVYGTVLVAESETNTVLDVEAESNTVLLNDDITNTVLIVEGC